MATEGEAPFHTTFGKMYDTDEDGHSCAITIIHTSVRTGHNELTRPTEAIFDTGATGSIITNRDLLSDLVFIQSTTFRGLTGHTRRHREGLLQPICRHVHNFGVRMCQQRTFLGVQGRRLPPTHPHQDQHTPTYKRSGSYIGDITDYQPIVHKAFACIYTAYIPTTSKLEDLYSVREVKRSATARRFQAALGFPSDVKLIRALKSGTFLNSDIQPEVVARATHMWGPSISAMKGRTVRSRPTPDSQKPVYLRFVYPQIMHCDIMYINKQAYLVSINHPGGLGMSQVACLCGIILRL